MNESVRWTAGRTFSAYVGTYDFNLYMLKLSNNAGVIDFTYEQARELLGLLPEAVRQLKVANNVPDEPPAPKPKPPKAPSVAPYQDTVRKGKKA